MKCIRVLGAGPAGSAAAMAALQEGALVQLIDKARFPRHKVCGEFLSPEAAGVLDSLGLWNSFAACGPASIRRMLLVVGNSVKVGPLPDTGWGCSRYALDDLLRASAISAGAETKRSILGDDRIDVMAIGRAYVSKRRERLFGFKAHFRGPVDDAVELYFFDGCYVGVCPIEGGITNVCGLGPEELLGHYRFDYDSFILRSDALTQRLRPLRRVMNWLTAGPLVFCNHFGDWSNGVIYPAGDALSFIDPFTGSGIVSALISGRLAGLAAARGIPVRQHLGHCHSILSSPFRVAAFLRNTLRLGLAERLVPLVPASLLFRLTRPHSALSRSPSA